MENKVKVLLMLSAIEKGLKSSNKEKTKDSIIKLVEMLSGEKKEDNMFLDDKENRIDIEELKRMDAEKIIEEFKPAIKEAKKFYSEKRY